MACSPYYCCSVAKSCPTLCNPMNFSTPGSSVLHCLPELAQIHVHWVGHAVQLLLSSPFAFSLSQHQSLFQWQLLASGGQSIGASASASVIPINIQGWFPLRLTGSISLQSKGLLRIFSKIGRASCRERVKAGVGGTRRWDGWMASLTQWTWVWANSRRQWRTGKPGMLWSMWSRELDTIWRLNNNCLLDFHYKTLLDDLWGWLYIYYCIIVIIFNLNTI